MVTSMQWPVIPGQTPIHLPTDEGPVLVQVAEIAGSPMLLICSQQAVKIPIVRFHSACVFGESLRAVDCDCGVQLVAALHAIVREGGIITYAWEEGRGLGIEAKLRAIALQQEAGIDTAQAFARLGHPPEPRNFENHVAVLRLILPGGPVRLASSNPKKVKALKSAGFEIVERVTLQVPDTPERIAYLAEKESALGHLRQ
ncbi:hypothetical protein [Sphingomonas alba]|uniref:hypothetical protein n=1 Tax=Sphingomonas alba TaxID=2908208 RepID=UPI003D68406B